MDKSWAKDYPTAELTEETLDENSSLKKMLHFIGENKRVVDFGCATGYFAQLLSKKGCVVTGVEINSDAAKIAERYCKEVIIADLDFVSIPEILPNQEFDVAVFGDVLEHLRNPWRVLKETKNILKENGYVVASIPNIAHGAIRLALLQGYFDYMDLGILDSTHLRFFTRKTVEELFERAGLFIESMEQTKLPIIADSHLIPSINKDNVDIKILEQIEQDENSDTLQFIIRGFPLSIESKYVALHQKYSQLIEQVEELHKQVEQMHEKREKAEIVIQDKQTILERSQSQLQQAQAELAQAKSQLQQTQAQLEHSLVQMHQNQLELQQLQTRITAMESSRFWKLRKAWFRLKRELGLKVDS